MGIFGQWRQLDTGECRDGKGIGPGSVHLGVENVDKVPNAMGTFNSVLTVE